MDVQRRREIDDSSTLVVSEVVLDKTLFVIIRGTHFNGLVLSNFVFFL